MGVPTHGLHYFLHSILPHLKTGNVNRGPIRTLGSVVVSEGTGGVGFQNLHRCLLPASEVAGEHGIALVVMSMPGKVGALRVFCHELTDRQQLVIMLKNTARTLGVPDVSEPIGGTNPLCIALPDTRFIYDSSMSTVATNKVRLAKKMDQTFPAPIGVDAAMQPTSDPNATIGAGGFLLPFSAGPYWFKSFFLGIAIEAMAALAGGSTSSRVGEHTGGRLHSREGMLAIVADRRAFPAYDRYVDEVRLLFDELEQHGFKVPGDYDTEASTVRVLADDWRQLQSV
jgi:delta1-piperideine-2-carboxylate reductase